MQSTEATATPRSPLERWFISTEAGWDPKLYEWWFTRNPMQAAIRAREAAAVRGLLEPLLTSETRVLEAGSGTGAHTFWAAERAAHVHATDAVPEMVAYLEERAHANVTVDHATLPHGLPSGTYDVALAVGVLNYLPDLHASLSALAGALEPGGHLVFTVPLHSPGGTLYRLGEAISRRRVWTYRPKQAAQIAERAGLAVRGMRSAGFTRRGFNLAVHAQKGGPA
jgi:SAM-dependent methyltransferase